VVRTLLRRKPRTRKDRMIAKLGAVKQRGTQVWTRIRRPRRRHENWRNVEQLFTHVAAMVRSAEAEREARRPRSARLHLPHRTG
jgi:hypothetical protein